MSEGNETDKTEKKIVEKVEETAQATSGNTSTQEAFNNDKSNSKKPGSTWTEADDKQLLTLKDDKKTWNDIASSLGKPKAEVSKRFGELKGVSVVSQAKEKEKKDELGGTATVEESEREKQNEPAGTATVEQPEKENESPEAVLLGFGVDLDDPQLGVDPRTHPEALKIWNGDQPNDEDKKEDKQGSHDADCEGGSMNVANVGHAFLPNPRSS